MAEITVNFNQNSGLDGIAQFNLTKADFVDQGNGEYFIAELYAPPAGVKCVSKEMAISFVSGSITHLDVSIIRTSTPSMGEMGTMVAYMNIGDIKLFSNNPMGGLLLSDSKIYLQIRDSSVANGQVATDFSVKGYIKVSKSPLV
jgi:hypothetical protein